MKKVILPTEILNTIWNEWLSQQRLNQYERQWIVGKPYGWPGASTNKKKRFDLWMFSQGGSIRRANKKIHIEFTDPAIASFFILRYS